MSGVAAEDAAWTPVEGTAPEGEPCPDVWGLHEATMPASWAAALSAGMVAGLAVLAVFSG